MSDTISIDDFKKLDIRVGTIVSADRVAGLDKIWKLSVDVGEESPRTILSGLVPWFPESELLVGKQVTILTNLEPRTIKGIESQGMLLAVEDESGVGLFHPNRSVTNGARVL